MKADLLIEILTEELPPKALLSLSNAFTQDIENQLRKIELNFSTIKPFATPRRLAALIENVASKQNDSQVERKGPAWKAAFDDQGKPTKACEGFAASCGTTPDKLTVIENEQGKWVACLQQIAGKTIQELMPDIIQKALLNLPIPKRMRWGNKNIEFVRPVHNVILLFDNQVIPADILGCKTNRKTKGHRFLSQGDLEINNPKTYEEQLELQGFVVANYDKRKNIIREQAEKITKNHVSMSDTLLNEVTGLVEWPVAILGQFGKEFLSVPQEVLISTMQDHQRYFPVLDDQGKILPQFVAISNIQSKNEAQVIKGNERVLRARLADAAFFFEKDKKETLKHRLEKLKHIVYQAKLGSLYEKAERIAKLAEWIAQKINIDTNIAYQAGLLAKTDLTTELVGEFPELQGIAGYYYALIDEESKATAEAIKEHYQPRFSGDVLPASLLGCAVALADRIDTLVGIFGINQPPTGDKDPFGLRRAALGVLRILIEKKLHLDLQPLLSVAMSHYQVNLENKNVVHDVYQFMLERLKPWYQEQGILADVFASVAALPISSPYDFHCRIQAVQMFKQMAAAEALSIANKRVSNILAKYPTEVDQAKIDVTLFENEAERKLADELKAKQHIIENLSRSAEYQQVLTELANLRQPVDDFFDKVMVMTEDKQKRENRLLLLKQLRELFLNVADIALLQ